MSSEAGKGKAFRFHVLSFTAHLTLAGLAVIAPTPEKSEEPIAITVAELVLAPEPEKEPEVETVPAPAAPEPPPPLPQPAPKPPPPPPPPKPAPKAEPPSPPPSAEAPPPETGDQAPAFADLGLLMGGGGPGGVAVGSLGRPGPRAATPRRSAPAAPPKRENPKCTEAPTKAKPKKIVRPAYTAEAQQAEIEGPVRLEVVIDENGHITSARVLKGLGYGLDEAAIAAARDMLFEPSRRCGVAVASTLTFNMRFTLGG